MGKQGGREGGGEIERGRREGVRGETERGVREKE